MKKQTFSTVISCIVILSSLVLIHMNATAQAFQPSNKAVESFIQKMEQGKDSVRIRLYLTIKDLQNLALNAYGFKIRPKEMEGGGGYYTGYKLPIYAEETSVFNRYAVDVKPDSITFTSEAPNGFGTVKVTAADDGVLHSWVLTGKFARKLK